MTLTLGCLTCTCLSHRLLLLDFRREDNEWMIFATLKNLRTRFVKKNKGISLSNKKLKRQKYILALFLIKKTIQMAHY